MSGMNGVSEPVTETQRSKGRFDFVAISDTAIVDHICKLNTNDELNALLPPGEEIGGSARIDAASLTKILSQVDFLTRSGGGTTNVVRGVAHLGMHTAIVGARGADEWGSIFHGSMQRARVNMDRVRVLPQPTARAAILVGPTGERTMRTLQDACAKLHPAELTETDFAAAWVLVSLFGLPSKGLVERSLQLARQTGAQVVVHMGSFEIVRRFRPEILRMLEEYGPVDLLVGNEDEAYEFLGTRDDASRIPERGCTAMLAHAKIAVVTAGDRGCFYASREQPEPAHCPAYTQNVKVVDTTGCGDMFTAGFVYALMTQGYSLDKCAYIGNVAGAATCQVLGAEIDTEGWAWFQSVVNGERASTVARESVDTVRHELQSCYNLINKLGRGLVYYGSARLKPGSGHWEKSVDLSQRLYRLLGVTTWTGGGPGMMESVTRGAMEIGAPVGAIRIGKEAGTRVLTSTYLPEGTEFTCKYLAPRKVGLTDSGIRREERERTGYVFLPGGLGTFDELLELMTLAQLRKLGTKFPVPIVIANYEGMYDDFISLLRSCEQHKTISADELFMVVVCETNDEIEAYMREFYQCPVADPKAHAALLGRVRKVSEWIKAVADDGAQTDLLMG